MSERKTGLRFSCKRGSSLSKDANSSDNRDSKAFPNQPTDLISPTCPGPPTSWTSHQGGIFSWLFVMSFLVVTTHSPCLCLRVNQPVDLQHLHQSVCQCLARIFPQLWTSEQSYQFYFMWNLLSSCSHPFPAENLRIECANYRSSHFTLGCTPPQCELEVMAQ